MNFELATAHRIVFGPGTLREAGPAAAAFGRRALVVTGATPGRASGLLEILHQHGVAVSTFSISGEPTTDAVLEGRAIGRSEGCDLVIGLGGGSALDAAKAIAALLTNPGELIEHLEVIGRARPLPHPAAPCIAIPTTAGTGAEVTRNAVLASPADRVKASLRSPGMLPRLAVVDPDLTRGVPPEVTATTGLDALTQLIEPYVCRRANPVVDAWCEAGLRRVARSLRRVFADSQDAEAREDMAFASLLGGLALANAGLGAVHGFAAPIGGMFPAPHGAVCAALLPHVVHGNLVALRARQPESPVIARYDEIARWLTANSDATADALVPWLCELCGALRIRPLSRYGVKSGDVPGIVEKAAQASSMKANPIDLSGSELAEILAAAV